MSEPLRLNATGITNYDEYSLVRDVGEEKKEETTGTLKKDKTLLRDDKKMEKLKQKLHTDDERTALPSILASQVTRLDCE